jgi:hypothetical protein
MESGSDGDSGHEDTKTLPDAELLESPADLMLEAHDPDVDLSVRTRSAMWQVNWQG